VATGQIDVGPVIAPGVEGIAGLTKTAKLCIVLVPQEFEAVTVIFPLAAVPDVETTIEEFP
jgi:hypothetical protein